MSRRIEIELTSARPDGSWTWRVAGARVPKGTLDGALLPGAAKVGGVYRADAEMELEGITIVSIVDPKGRPTKSGQIELIPSNKPFDEVTQQLAKRERGERPRRDGDDRPRGDRPRGDRPGGDRPRGERPGGDRPRGPGSDRPGGDRSRPGGDRSRDGRPAGGGEGGDSRGPRPERRNRPHFTPPPELPQRPKARRLKPGRVHRNLVLAELPEAQRPVAERALQGGIPAVRQAINEQNARLKAEGNDEIPAAGMLSMAEQLLPKLRVAEWLDRADAAKADLDELDLRDLRSVVAASDDPMVARDETTREIAAELKLALVTKQEKELGLWYGDIDAAISVGRVIRALKLSSQPPKAGVRFPAEIAKRLVDASVASLTADAATDRWSAVLEAAAFSPVRAQITPTARPENPGDELLATIKRLASLLPQIATLFGIDVAPGASSPKPLRPAKPGPPAKKAAPPPPRPPKPPAAATAEPTAPAEVAAGAVEPAAVEPAAEAVEPAAEAVEPAAVEPEPEVAAEPEPEPAAVEPEPEPEPAAEPEPEPEPEAASATAPATEGETTTS